jgi:hypothetical protein
LESTKRTKGAPARFAMHQSEEPAKRPRTKRRKLWSAWTTLGLSVSLGAAGCSQTQAVVAPAHDPIRDPIPVPAQQPPAIPTSNSRDSQQGAATVPPIPSTLGATNNASLAPNSELPGGRPLSIPERTPTGQLTNTTKSAPVTSAPHVTAVPDDTGAPAAAPGLQPASSWTAPPSATAPAILPVSNPAPAAPATLLVTTDNFAKMLAERGFTLQHLRQASLPQGIHVTCLASAPGTAEQSVFEVTAANFDEAGHAILREADRRAAGAR